MSFFVELKRRNVFKVAAAYLIVGWLIMQAGDTLAPALRLPEWVNSLLAFFLILGFPLAMFFSWAYEMTPEGLKKEKDVDHSQSTNGVTSPGMTGRKLDFFIIGMLAIAVGYFLYERFAHPVPVEPGASAKTSWSMQPSIAVLPFVDMSPQSDQAYFSDGISEELLNLLAHVDGIRVASRTSSFSYKGDQRKLAEIAAELKVTLVLEGSVRKAGNKVRITAQLIDATTDTHLLSKAYDRDLTDIFAIQDEIANAIVNVLKTKLGLADSTSPVVVTADTENLDAYQLYLQARSLFIARNNLGHSIELFNQAIELDPGFARAWEGLAAVLYVAEGWGVEGENLTAQSREAAQKAIELDPGLSMSWAVSAALTTDIDADYINGMSEFDRAIENDPLSATVWFWRGIHYATLGFADKSISDISRCIEIDPAYMNCYRHLSRVYLMRGDVDKALTTYLTNLEAGFSINDFWFIHPLMEGDQEFAAAFLLRSEANGDRDYPYKGLLNAIKNPTADHSATVTRLDQWVKRSGKLPKWQISEWIALGAYDRVEPVADSVVVWLPSSRQFRASSWFKPLVRKLGWPAYWREYGFPPQCRPIGEEDFECDGTNDELGSG